MNKQDCIHEKRIRNQYILAILIAYVVLSLYWIGLNVYEGRVYPYDLTKAHVNNVIKSDIDTIKKEKDYIEVSGWAFCPGKHWKEIEASILLVDQSTGEALRIPTELYQRPDIQELYGHEGYDYTLSGFHARVKVDKIQLDSRKYDVYVSITLDERKFIKEIKEDLGEAL